MVNYCKCFLLKTRRRSVKVLNAAETVDYIKRTGCSMARYGDGELNMVFNFLDKSGSRLSGFQDYSEEMGKRLYEILQEGGNARHNFHVALPGCMLKVGTGYLRKNARMFWINYTAENFGRLMKIIDVPVKANQKFLETNISRFYLSHRNKGRCPIFIGELKSIWEGRDIIIVEGEKTRLGVGNDLFDNAKSITRILAPATNAFSKYSEILQTVLTECNKGITSNSGYNRRGLCAFTTQDMGGGNPLIIIALGMTATILARDLAKEGYQALDLGHIDIEYMWMKMGATEKVPVPGKFTNEAHRYIANDQNDNVVLCEYKNQIVAWIQ